MLCSVGDVMSRFGAGYAELIPGEAIYYRELAIHT